MAAYRPRPVFQLKKDPDHPKGSTTYKVNCDPTAAATLVDFVTCGERRTTGAAIRELTNDFEEGTSIGQVARAVAKGFHIDLDVNSSTFPHVVHALEAGRGVSLCGSSIATHGTEFQGSETFTGNHQWALTDIRKRADGTTEILVYDPLADGRRKHIDRAPSWIPIDLVRSFAGNLDLRSKAEIKANKPRRPLGIGRATYAVTEVNRCAADAGAGAPALAAMATLPAVQLRQGAVPVGGADGRELEVAVPVGRVRERPSTMADIVGRKQEGDAFLAFQKIRGQRVAGSHVWFGDRLGSRWMHRSLFKFPASPGGGFAAAPGDPQDLEMPGDDPETIGLPDGVEIPDADDEILEGVEDEVDEPILDEVPAELDAPAPV